MVALVGVIVILAAIYAVVRKIDVRLALLLAALTLGGLAGQPQRIVREFFATLSNEQFIVPICCSMGFAYVLRHTGCDRHLVQLLAEPVRRVRRFVVPGTVLIGFLVNITIISQASTVVTIGPVLVPLLRAARLRPAMIGAALLLGTSLGGELLNPGAPELQTVSRSLQIRATDCVAHVAPVLFIQVGAATLLFWLQSTWFGSDALPDKGDAEAPAKDEPFRVNYFKVGVPLVPLVLLFLTGPPLQLVSVPRSWLIDEKTPPPPVAAASTVGLLAAPDGQGGLLAASSCLVEISPPPDPRFDSRLIGAAMLVGVLVAALAGGRTAVGTARAFFEGAGHAFTYIIALIVSANCLGAGVKSIGLDKYLGAAIGRVPSLLMPAAVVLPLAFAVLCGSGYASTQSLYEFFVAPARRAGIDPANVGALVSLSAAAGRTMSPVAAVTLLCASLSDAEPLALVKRVAGPLCGGLLVVVCVRMLGIV